MKTIHFAICADQNIEVGLHVTLYSAMKNLHSDSYAVAHLFLKGFDEKRLEKLKLTLKEFGDRCVLKFYDAANIDVGEGIGLHGNKMPYILFQIPNFVGVDKVLCLDSDLLIKTDLTVLYNWDLKNNIIGIVSEIKVRESWIKERDFLVSIGVSEEAIYFNTGVVLIDVKLWKANSITEKCLEFTRLHSQKLNTADQTVLNALLHDSAEIVPKEYNIGCYPGKAVKDMSSREGIYHFLGSPKPWDFLGEYLHISYDAFHEMLLNTAHRNYKSFTSLSSSQLTRTFKLRGSYFRVIESRLRGK